MYIVCSYARSQGVRVSLEVEGFGPTGKSISARVVRAGEAKLRGRERLIPAVARDNGQVGQNVPGVRRPAGARPAAGVGRCWLVLGGASSRGRNEYNIVVVLVGGWGRSLPRGRHECGFFELRGDFQECIMFFAF